MERQPLVVALPPEPPPSRPVSRAGRVGFFLSLLPALGTGLDVLLHPG